MGIGIRIGIGIILEKWGIGIRIGIEYVVARVQELELGTGNLTGIGIGIGRNISRIPIPPRVH